MTAGALGLTGAAPQESRAETNGLGNTDSDLGGRAPPGAGIPFCAEPVHSSQDSQVLATPVCGHLGAKKTADLAYCGVNHKCLVRQVNQDCPIG